MKKYLKTVEDIEALRNTDTKIYCTDSSSDETFWKFVNGVLCLFKGKKFLYNDSIWLSTTPGSAEYYIEVEDEPSEVVIGKLGWVSDTNPEEKHRCCVLVKIAGYTGYRFVCTGDTGWKYFTPLTPEEVEKYTGYKVVNDEMQASGLADNKLQAKEV